MNISDQHFKELGIPHFGSVFGALDIVLRKHSVPCYLIGAAAKDLQALRNGVKPIRYTLDIDFAIMVPDHETYNRIMADVKANGFHPTREPYRVVHTASDTLVDILPFGAIEEKGTVRFTDRDTALVMLGFAEVLTDAEDLRLADGRSLHVAPLPGMCLLKLLAFGDRPERTKDLSDILSIIDQYFDTALEKITGEHADLLTDPFDRNTCSAQVIGRTIGNTIRNNAAAVDHVQHTLAAHLRDPDTSRIALHWAAESKCANTLTFAWLKALSAGIEEGSRS